MTHDLWASLNKKILDYLADVTLGSMVVKQLSKKEVVMTQKSKQKNTGNFKHELSEITTSANV